MAAALRFPADPALRRQLWKQWVHLDPPRAEDRAQDRAVRRAVAIENVVAADQWARATIEATPGVVDGLTEAIKIAVIDGRISLADRERLTTRATRLGLSRFDASLLVAAVQHREAESAGLNVVRVWKRPKQTRSLGTIVATCVALEVLAAAGVMLWLRV